MKLTARHLEYAGGALVLGGIAYMLFGSPSASTTPAALLQRPLKPSARMTPSDEAAVVRVGQAQLKYLGYSVTRVDGISGPETQAAVNAFIARNQTAVDHLAAQVGNANYDVAVSLAIDDQYRERRGLPRATLTMA